MKLNELKLPFAVVIACTPPHLIVSVVVFESQAIFHSCKKKSETTKEKLAKQMNVNEGFFLHMSLRRENKVKFFSQRKLIVEFLQSNQSNWRGFKTAAQEVKNK